MRAPSETGPIAALSSGRSRRFYALFVFFALLNGAGLWWIREGARHRAGGARATSVSPSGESPTRLKVSVGFSRDVIPEDPQRQLPADLMIQVRSSQGVSIGGRAHWEGLDRLVFDPWQPLPPGQEIQIRLSPEIGRPETELEGPFQFSFRTEPLKLIAASQLRYAGAAARRSRSLSGLNEAIVRLGLNSRVVPAELSSHLILLGSGDSPIPYTILSEEPSEDIDIRCSPKGTSVVAVLGPARPGRRDTLGIRAESRISVELTSVLSVTAIRGGRVFLERPSLEVYFNNPVVLDGTVRLEDFFAIEPPLPFTAAADWSRVALDAEFQPGSRYQVTVKKGLTGASGSQLLEDVQRTVALPDREPSLGFEGDGTFLSGQGNLSLLLKSVNVRSVSVQASRVHPNNLVHALDIGWARTRFTRALPARIYHPSPGVNEIRELAIDLRDVIGLDPRGVWYVTASSGPGESERADASERLVSVSDIGITSKLAARGGMLVWAVSLRTGAPLQGVEVSIRSQTNQLIAQARTDENGLCRFEPLSDADGPPHVVLAEKEGDLAYLELTKRNLSLADFDVGGRPALDAGLEAFLFTDRGVYRPGETVRLRSLVRGPGGAMPGEFPVELETLRPDGKRLRIEKLTLRSEGALDASIALSSTASTGLYRARLLLPGGQDAETELGATSFRVEEYMPARLDVSLQLAEAKQGSGPRRLRPGESVEVIVKGTHLFGLPAAGCQVEATFHLETAPFTSKAWKAFSFGELSPKRSRWSLPADSAVLDASGEARVHVALPNVETAVALYLRCTARVLDVGGRAVTGELDVPVDPAPHYLGLRAIPSEGGGSSLNAKQASRFECVAVYADGLPASLESADLIVQSVRWLSVLRKSSNGLYRYESREEVKEIARRRVVLSSGRGAFEHTFEQPGSYRLRIKDPASLAAAELSVYASGAGAAFFGASMEKPERLDLSFARSACRPGETAKLIVRSPFAGTLLITTETSAIETARVISMTDSVTEVEIPIPEGASRTLYAAASVVRGVDPNAEWVPHRAFGVAPIPIDFSRNQLTVTLEAPAEARPLSSCAVRATVATEDGEPVRGAELIVALVDEGILSLTREALPDPFGCFFGKRSCGVTSADTFTSLAEEVPLLRERSRPGGDGDGEEGGKKASGGAEPRRPGQVAVQRVKPAVIWSGPLTTGEDGGVVAEFQLPQFTGELRFFAVASAGGRFGSSRRAVTVRGPFFFEMSLPRFLAPGDAFTVPVAAFNRMEAGGPAHLDWTLDGLAEGLQPPETGLAFASLKDSTLEVPGEGAARCVFALKTSDRPGKASARLEASLGGETFAETVELPVRIAAPRTRRVESGSVTAQGALELAPSTAYADGTASWKLVLSSFPDMDLAESLQYLIHYPHGCLEQTTSSVFPLVHMKSLVEATGLLSYSGSADSTSTALARLDEYVLAGIERILEMQSYGGWFGTWPGAREAWRWGGIYATHFLVEARSAGYLVPELELDMALRSIDEDIVRGKRSEVDSDALERAYGLYVLALAKKPDVGSMDRLREEYVAAARGGPKAASPDAQEFPPTARFLLGGAYMLRGNVESAHAILGSDLPDVGTTRDLGGLLRSPARETAILLATLADAVPGDPRLPSLAERLRDLRKNGRWQTTQENAFALLALGKFARTRLQAPQDFRATVEVPGQPALQLGPGESRVLQGVQLEAPLKVNVEGPGSIYYSWVDEGVPADGKAPEMDDGVKVRRRFLDRTLNPMDRAAIPLGEIVIVELSIESSAALENLAVTDMLPAGLEAENPNLGSVLPTAEGPEVLAPKHVSIRDDRVIAYFDPVWSGGKLVTSGVYRYAARAVTRGDFALPPVEAEALYSPGTRSVSGAGRVTIR